VDKPRKSVMHGQWYDRSTVTFPITGHHYPATGINLYYFMTETVRAGVRAGVRARVCEQLA